MSPKYLREILFQTIIMCVTELCSLRVYIYKIEAILFYKLLNSHIVVKYKYKSPAIITVKFTFLPCSRSTNTHVHPRSIGTDSYCLGLTVAPRFGHPVGTFYGRCSGGCGGCSSSDSSCYKCRRPVCSLVSNPSLQAEFHVRATNYLTRPTQLSTASDHDFL